jgi:hypothetical protein
MIRILYTIFCLFLVITVNAQITGKVIDSKGQPVIGASVQLKGTDRGTVTDLDGLYTMNASEGILVFTYTGFQQIEMTIGDQSTIDVVMQEMAYNLNDVVVVGYGVQKKADLTTAVVTCQ